MKKSTRKPFVAPRLREEASLAGVTLISGGVPTGTSNRKGKGYAHTHSNTRHGHGT